VICAKCKRRISAAVTLEGIEWVARERYCVECFRKEVYPSLPEDQAEYEREMEKLTEIKRIQNIKYLTAKMNEIDRKTARVEP